MKIRTLFFWCGVFLSGSMNCAITLNNNDKELVEKLTSSSPEELQKLLKEDIDKYNSSQLSPEDTKLINATKDGLVKFIPGRMLLPEGVSIGKFGDAENSPEIMVKLPGGVSRKMILGEAMRGSTRELVISASLKEVEKGAFKDYTNLKKVWYPKDWKDTNLYENLENELFSDENHLDTVIEPYQ